MSFFTDIIGEMVTPLDFSKITDFGTEAGKWLEPLSKAIDPVQKIYGAITDDPLRQTSTTNSGFGKLAITAPVLAAINYANNQGPFDTSRHTALFDQYSPQASAIKYDQNSQNGRQALTNSLTARGVMGSVFGDSDLGSYDATRASGRSALFNQGIQSSAGIAGDILNADVQSQTLKNRMIGSALSIQAEALNSKKKPSVPSSGY
jgi:hypothetical protein